MVPMPFGHDYGVHVFLPLLKTVSGAGTAVAADGDVAVSGVAGPMDADAEFPARQRYSHPCLSAKKRWDESKEIEI